jgi:large subunit ribosomal protein L24
MQQKHKIHKDDNVEILAGKDKGKRGTVIRVFEKNGHVRVIVGDANLVKKAIRRRSQQDAGGIAEVEAPLDISNVGLVCKKCGRPVKVGYKLDGDKKIRVCRKCGEAL